MIIRFSFLFAILVLVFLDLTCDLQVQLPSNNTVYEVFVRSFFDSNGDGIGDIRGLTQRLDYLNDGDPQTDEDLEVGILWLMPVFPSVSYHGYDVNNYRDIHPDYGTLTDFDHLVEAAHERGLRIILDIPFNHTSNEHPWFKDAIENPITSPYKDYYFLGTDDRPEGDDWHWTKNSSGQEIHYFADFSYTMPDLNMDNPDVKEEVKQIAKFWLDHGVDGFRLDAAKHIFAWSDHLSPEEIQKNISWWKEFSDYVYSVDSTAILVGEVLASHEVVQQFAAGLDAELDFHFKHHLREFVKKPYSGFLELWKTYFDQARQNNAEFELYPFVSSHDTNPRFASFVKQYAKENFDPAYRVGMYLLLTVGKYPVLYYGDEIRQEGWKWNGANPPDGDGSNIWDETLREPFPWYHKSGSGQTNWFQPRFDERKDGISVEEQFPSDSSMLSLVRALTNFRAEHPEFANGEISNIIEDTTEQIVFEKIGGNNTFLILINNTSQTAEFEAAAYQNGRMLFWADGLNSQWKDLSNGVEREEEIVESISVPPFGLVILEKI